MLKGKTVKIRHKPVLAVIEGCRHKFVSAHFSLPKTVEIATGETWEGGSYRGIRKSESLPVTVDMVIFTARGTTGVL